jgi:hypothetical protein
MPLYKFYRIVPKDATKTDCYIGHTVQPLRKRFKGHYDRMNRVGSGSCSSAILFRNYGKGALEIVLIHELELPDKEYARREERRLYEEHRERAVNKYKPYVTDEERKERDAILHRAYNEANKDTILPAKKLYREAHKEHQAEQQRVWREANRDKVSADKKVYYETKYKALRVENKEHHNEVQRQRRARESALKYLRILLE